MVTNGNIIPISLINSLYTSIFSIFNAPSDLRLEGVTFTYKLVFSSSVGVPGGFVQNKEYGWSCNNLGNREYFEEWMKYNMYGTDSTMVSSIDGGSLHGGNSYSNFNNSTKNKFKSYLNSHIGYSGVIRSDLSMDELMKPENFRELLYEMKTITPMYVIGYVDKERYPEQYEALMNEMGYKYTITSAVIEDGYFKVYYSNEGKNGIKSISKNTAMIISLKFKNKLKNTNIYANRLSINRSQTATQLNLIGTSIQDIGVTKINMGDAQIFTSNSALAEVVSRPYISGKLISISKAIEEAYGKNMVDDVYLELILLNEYIGYQSPAIKLANVNRTTEINLTDSGLLHMFISNNNSTDAWFDTMYMNHIKIDDNGWI